MPPKTKNLLIALAMTVVFNLQLSAFGQGTTAFAYQGQLRNNGTNANGTYTMIFRLYDSASGGNQIGGDITDSATLTNGSFSVNLDFGGGAFDGNARWLEITVTNGPASQTLSPRTQILPTPYAIAAATANSVLATNITGTVPDAQLSSNVALRDGGNSFSGNQTITSGSLVLGTPDTPYEDLLINGGNAMIVGANAGQPGANGSLFLGSDPSTRDGSLSRTTAGDMAFWRYDGVWHESMRILNASGNVGIGKVDPATALDVNGTVTATSFSGSGAGLTSLPDQALSANVAFRAGGNDFTGQQTFTGGHIGIGTTSPLGYSLDIRGNMSLPAGSGGSIYFDGANVTGQEWQLFHNSSEAFGPTNGLVFYNGTAQSTALVIAPSGNVGIGQINPATALDVYGTITCVSLNQTSDRNAKEHFASVSSREILEKVAGLNITRWNFKGDERTPHVGPMAQDFFAAFNVGVDDKHIATVDENGVALAAIQGLNEKLEGTSHNAQKQIEELKAENTELKVRLEKLEQVIAAQNGGRQ